MFDCLVTIISIRFFSQIVFFIQSIALKKGDFTMDHEQEN